jgi:hypothetical protein
LQLLFGDKTPIKHDELMAFVFQPGLMRDVVSEVRWFEALTGEATLCQGPGMPILRFIGCLHPPNPVV